MATFDYISSRNDAKEIIGEFGTVASIGDYNSSYDPVTGIETGSVVTKTDATIVSLPASSMTGISKLDDSFVEDLRKGKARLFLVAAKGLDFPPAPGHILLFENKVWDLDGATPLNPTGLDPVMYSLGAKLSTKPTSLFESGDYEHIFWDTAKLWSSGELWTTTA